MEVRRFSITRSMKRVSMRSSMYRGRRQCSLRQPTSVCACTNGIKGRSTVYSICSFDFVPFPSYCKSVLSISLHSTKATTAASTPKYLMKTQIQIQCNHACLQSHSSAYINNPAWAPPPDFATTNTLTHSSILFDHVFLSTEPCPLLPSRLGRRSPPGSASSSSSGSFLSSTGGL